MTCKNAPGQPPMVFPNPTHGQDRQAMSSFLYEPQIRSEKGIFSGKQVFVGDIVKGEAPLWNKERSTLPVGKRLVARAFGGHVES